MSRPSLPQPLRRILRALERRLFTVLLGYGAGRAVLKLCALLLALYLLDRLLDTPAAPRMVLLVLGLLLWGVHLFRDLIDPLRARPRRADLASLWERQVPELGDRLLTVVQLRGRADAGSPEMLAAVEAQAVELAEELRAEEVVPTGRMRRSLLGGGGAAALLAALALLAPTEAGIFLQRLGGAEIAWPSDTRLVLLPAYVEGAAEPVALTSEGGERFSLAVARGSIVSLRVQAEGKVPTEVVAYGAGQPRRLHPFGGDVFVLRLPPLYEDLSLDFRGGDDDDGLPRLRLLAGDAPRVRDWAVQVRPPAYTGLPSEQGALTELRALRGSTLQFSFRVDRPAASAETVSLDGTRAPLTADADGGYGGSFVVDGSGEIAIALAGTDGFRQERAAVLRWDAIADRTPEPRIAWPESRWQTVPGGQVPVIVAASDDYGLASVRLFDGEESEIPLHAADGRREYRHLVRLPAPVGGDGGVASDPRLRLRVQAVDFAEPDPQAAEASSDWIEVLPPALYEQRLAERMVRMRIRVEQALERARALRQSGAQAELRPARRLRRDLEGMLADTEEDLVQRLFSGLDNVGPRVLTTVEEVLAVGPPETGALVAALGSAGLPALDGRSALLNDLAGAFALARRGPAEDLVNALEDDLDPGPPAEELVLELEAILDILVAWEDFQSAVNLLRDLLERQRGLYLRTLEATDR